MYTQCPDCTSVFEISPEHLAAAGGMVQCGVCDTTFNALRRLTKTPPEEPASIEAGPAAESTALDNERANDTNRQSEVTQESTAAEPDNEHSRTREDAADHPDSHVQSDRVETSGDHLTSISANANSDEEAGLSTDDPDKSVINDGSDRTDKEWDEDQPDSADSSAKTGDATVNPDDLFSISQVLDDWNTDEAELDLKSVIQREAVDDDVSSAQNADATLEDERDEAPTETEYETETETENEPEPEPEPDDDDLTDEVKTLQEHAATSPDLPDAGEPGERDPDEVEQDLQAVLDSDDLADNDIQDSPDDEAEDRSDDDPNETPGNNPADDEPKEEKEDAQIETGEETSNPDDFFSTSQVLDEWDLDEGEHVLEAMLADELLLDEIGVETEDDQVAHSDDSLQADDPVIGEHTADKTAGKESDAETEESPEDATSSDDPDEDRHKVESDGQDGHETGASADQTDDVGDIEEEDKTAADGEDDEDGEQSAETAPSDKAKHPDSGEADLESDAHSEHKGDSRSGESSDDDDDEEYDAQLGHLLGDECDEDLDMDEFYASNTSADDQPEPDEPRLQNDTVTADSEQAGDVEEPDKDKDKDKDKDESEGEDHSPGDGADLTSEESTRSDKEVSDSSTLLTDGVDGKFEDDDAEDLKDLGNYLSPKKSLVRRLGEGLIVLALVGGLAGQYVHYNRAELATHPEIGTYVQNIYQKLGKDLRANWRVNDYRVARHTIVPSDEDSKLLLARATVVNNTAFERPLPLIRLQIKNRWGDSIYGRVFGPDEYLSEAPHGALAGNGRLEVSLDLFHPAPEEEIGYSFDVCLDTPNGPDCGTPQIFTE